MIGLHEGLGDQASKLIVVETSYETTSPTVDTQIVQIKAANPDIFINVATPKFAAQAIKKIARTGLASGAVPDQRVGFGRRRVEAGRLRGEPGHPERGLPEGPKDRHGRTMPP